MAITMRILIASPGRFLGRSSIMLRAVESNDGTATSESEAASPAFATKLIQCCRLYNVSRARGSEYRIETGASEEGTEQRPRIFGTSPDPLKRVVGLLQELKVSATE